jgi:predicted NUDIX family NTP pyrophosphohydrolase
LPSRGAKLTLTTTKEAGRGDGALRELGRDMAKRSAGLLLYRRKGPALEVLLAHPGGPFWAKKDAGAWSIPKGLCEDNEDPLAAARREFAEETGFEPDGNLVALGSFKQPGGKVILAWGIEGDFDPRDLTSNSFAMEWPPKSGRQREFPEVDRAAWFEPDEAARKLTRGQVPILAALCRQLGVALKEPGTPASARR